MKKIAFLSLLLLGFAFGGQAQKLSKDEIAKYENEIQMMVSYLEETMNFIGDSTTANVEKEIVFTESWSKVFIDDKVQIEDDLDVNRNTPINKDVQAYLKTSTSSSSGPSSSLTCRACPIAPETTAQSSSRPPCRAS